MADPICPEDERALIRPLATFSHLRREKAIILESIAFARARVKPEYGRRCPTGRMRALTSLPFDL
jgi:hypothetical protein